MRSMLQMTSGGLDWTCVQRKATSVANKTDDILFSVLMTAPVANWASARSENSPMPAKGPCSVLKEIPLVWDTTVASQPSLSPFLTELEELKGDLT